MRFQKGNPGFLDAAVKTVAYLRVSTRSQDLSNQKLAILDYAQKQQLVVDRFIELQVSSRRVRHRESIEQLLLELTGGGRRSRLCPP